MGQVMDCDSCNKVIGFSERVQLSIPSDQHAGIMIELCLECAANVIADPKVALATERFEARVAAFEPVLPTTPEEPALEHSHAIAEMEATTEPVAT